MGKSNKVCPRCGHKMKQQFIGLQHCRCGMSWKRDIGFFERTPDMVFGLRHNKPGQKSKIPTIRQLNQEYAQVLSGKKAAYAEYREARKQMQDYLIVRKNIEAILGVEQEE